MRVAIVVLLVACGRIGFDPTTGDGGGGGGDADARVTPEIVGVTKYGGGGLIFPVALSAKSDGTVAIGGMFTGQVDFGGGPFADSGSVDFFVARYASGAPAGALRSTGAGEESTSDFERDSSGNYYLVGYFDATIDLGGGAMLVPYGQRDCFIVSLMPSGGLRWAERIGGIEADTCQAAAVDANDNLYIVGAFSGTANFPDGSFASAGMTDLFVTSFTRDGTPRFTSRFGGIGGDYVIDVAVDVGGSRIVLAGGAGAPFAIGSDTVGTTAAGGFVAMVDATTGLPSWGRMIASSPGGLVGPTAVGFDGSAAFVVGGITTSATSEAVDFGGGTLTTNSDDAFLAVFTRDGGYRAARVLGGADTDFAINVRAGALGPYLVGSFVDPIVVDGTTVGSAGTWTGILSFTPDAALRWGLGVGPVTLTDLGPIGDRLWVSGQLAGSATFPQGTLTADGVDLLLFELDRL